LLNPGCTLPVDKNKEIWLSTAGEEVDSTRVYNHSGFTTREGEMLRILVSLFFVFLVCGEVSAQTAQDPIKACGVLDLKCINDNFQQLQRELDSANAVIATLTKQVTDLTARINNTSTGLDALNKAVTTNLPDQISTLSNFVHGNLDVMSTNRSQCLAFGDMGKGGAGFAGCDSNPDVGFTLRSH
jgi:hypothetical protein